jgi:hypothetical protein
MYICARHAACLKICRRQQIENEKETKITQCMYITVAVTAMALHIHTHTHTHTHIHTYKHTHKRKTTTTTTAAGGLVLDQLCLHTPLEVCDLITETQCNTLSLTTNTNVTVYLGVDLFLDTYIKQRIFTKD